MRGQGRPWDGAGFTPIERWSKMDTTTGRSARLRGTVSIQDTTPGLLVLAVDDEAHGLDELTYLLGQNPQVRRVIGAYDAAEALRVIRGSDTETKQRLDRGLCPVDAVFADISMPGLSGLELAQVINAFRDKPQL